MKVEAVRLNRFRQPVRLRAHALMSPSNREVPECLCQGVVEDVGRTLRPSNSHKSLANCACWKLENLLNL
jgi:hypothetical protein